MVIIIIVIMNATILKPTTGNNLKYRLRFT